MLSNLRTDQIHKLAGEGKRIDGRGPMEVRPIVLEKGKFEKSDGSCLVRLGNTVIGVGIKAKEGTPYPDTPNKGAMMTTGELSPIASPTFEAGPPREAAIEFARVVDRSIREGEIINFSDLCIVPGEKIIMLFIDMQVLDYDGNLFDAGNYGALAALSRTVVKYSEIIEGREDAPLPMGHKPVSVTFFKINGKIMVDPNLDEDIVSECRLTVGVDENGIVRAMQKGGNGSFAKEEVSWMINKAVELTGPIRELIFDGAA